MARRKAEETVAAQGAQVEEIVTAVADAMAMPEDKPVTGYIANPSAKPREREPGIEPDERPRRQYKPDPNPFPMEHIKAGGNVVRLLKELPNDRAGFPGAFVIRFDKNPNEGQDASGKPYGKDHPHPALVFLKKEAGYGWGFSDADGKGGWGKLWDDGQFNFREHMDARVVLKKCAELLGPVQEAERSPF